MMIYIIQDLSGDIISAWSTWELADAEVKRITAEGGAENDNMWNIIPRMLDVPVD